MAHLTQEGKEGCVGRGGKVHHARHPALRPPFFPSSGQRNAKQSPTTPRQHEGSRTVAEAPCVPLVGRRRVRPGRGRPRRGRTSPVPLPHNRLRRMRRLRRRTTQAPEQAKRTCTGTKPPHGVKGGRGRRRRRRRRRRRKRCCGGQRRVRAASAAAELGGSVRGRVRRRRRQETERRGGWERRCRCRCRCRCRRGQGCEEEPETGGAGYLGVGGGRCVCVCVCAKATGRRGMVSQSSSALQKAIVRFCQFLFFFGALCSLLMDDLRMYFFILQNIYSSWPFAAVHALLRCRASAAAEPPSFQWVQQRPFAGLPGQFFL